MGLVFVSKVSPITLLESVLSALLYQMDSLSTESAPFAQEIWSIMAIPALVLQVK